jgi:diguanylate cyclase (GGDEF)-like protein
MNRFKNWLNYNPQTDYKNRILYYSIAIVATVALLFLILYILYIPFLPAIIAHIVYIIFNLSLYIALKNRQFTLAKFGLLTSYFVQLTLAVFLWFPICTGFFLLYCIIPVVAFMLTDYNNKSETLFSTIISSLTIICVLLSVLGVNFAMYQPREILCTVIKIESVLSLMIPMIFIVWNMSWNQFVLQQELAKLANTDALTKILNRRALFTRGAQEYKLARKYKHDLTIILIDIDYFKKINDTYGHPVGDAILFELAQLIRCNIRKEDIFARYGGEEFAVLLRRSDTENSLKIAEHLLEKIRNHIFHINNNDITLTISIGLSQLSPEHSSIDTMISNADKALYHAKKQGRDRVKLYNKE